MSIHYYGSCHCGAVQFDFDGEEITEGLRCNCSLCSRKGAMMNNYAIPPEKFHITAKDEDLGLYQFGSKTAKHYFCNKCGIYPFHVTARMPDHFRVNLACVEGVDPSEFKYEFFDGKHLL